MACEEGSITIPHDIIIGILHRVPAKSVGRFRCVSKEWLSSLSDPGFIKTHEKTLSRTHLIFLLDYVSLYSLPFDNHEGVSTLTKLSLPFDNHKGVSTLTKLPFESGVVDLQGSCNGLVLVSTCDQTLYIINPTTKDSVQLADSPAWLGYKHHFSVYGFGYDYVTDDYKVVTMTYHTYIHCDKSVVHVYSLRTNTWRKVSDSPYDHSQDGCCSGVSYKGFLHWIARKRTNRIPVVVAYSLANEKFSEVPSPDFYTDDDILNRIDYYKLVALGEKLAIFDHVKGVVWLMNDYEVKSSWTKIVVHGLSETPMVKPMIFYENGKIVFVNRDLMVLKNTEEKCLDKSDFRWYMNVLELTVKGTYVESLFVPKIGSSN